MSAPTLHLPPPHGLPQPKATYLAYPSLSLGRGESLYRAGDEAVSLFRIEEGLLKQSFHAASGRERVIGLAGPGDLVGAIGTLVGTPVGASVGTPIGTPMDTPVGIGGSRYGESATALSPSVRATVIPADHIGLDQGLKDDVLAATAVQLRRAHDILEDGELPTPARLARALLRLGGRFGHITTGGQVLLKLPLTHDTLAAMVGAARETTTATLGEMRALGILSGTRGQYSFYPGELSDFVLERCYC